MRAGDRLGGLAGRTVTALIGLTSSNSLVEPVSTAASRPGSEIAFPHSSQNFDPGSFRAPQCGHLVGVSVT